MKKLNSIVVSLISIITVAAMVPVTVQASTLEDTNVNPTDDYVLSDIYIDPNGNILDKSDGLIVTSGSFIMSPGGKWDRASTKIQWGSSYVSSVEKIQLFYTGEAYASGKKDYQDPNTPWTTKRVVEACFKYTREGKDLIGWQCSKAALGPVYGPGAKVSKTVSDNLTISGPKTEFRYSFKAY